MGLELNRAYGFDFVMLGCCMISFKDLLSRPDKLIGTGEIISTNDNVSMLFFLGHNH
jgi:hypothetical protein